MLGCIDLSPSDAEKMYLQTVLKNEDITFFFSCLKIPPPPPTSIFYFKASIQCTVLSHITGVWQASQHGNHMTFKTTKAWAP